MAASDYKEKEGVIVWPRAARELGEACGRVQTVRRVWCEQRVVCAMRAEVDLGSRA